MNISALVKSQQDGEDIGDTVYGVVVDKLIDNTLKDISEIGLIASLEDDGKSISLDVIDTVLAYVSVGVNVILEVPYDLDIPAQDIIILALNCGIDISVLPPSDAGFESWKEYSDILIKYTDIWLNQKNSKKMVYPSSGFLQYMVGEVFGYKPNSISSDDYFITNFVKRIDLCIMDEIKEELRKTIYNAFEGENNFEIFAHSLADALAEKIKEESLLAQENYLDSQHDDNQLKDDAVKKEIQE